MGIKDRGHEIARGQKRRSKKKFILVALEGNNQTERLYFENFRKNEKYVIHYARGNDTSPIQMMESLKKDKVRLGIETGNKDIVACIFDSDEELNKQTEIKRCLDDSEKNDIEVIISNPCFEIWYLCHFSSSTKHYKNEDVIRELKKYIPGYKKASNIYTEISVHTSRAIQNAKYLEKYHSDLNRKFGDMSTNPSTNFYKIVETLII